MNGKWKRWEAALLAGVAIAISAGAYLDREQDALAENVIRLHVIANSDSEGDQALKLAVRDRVLEAAGALYDPEDSVTDALAKLDAHLDEIAAAGRAEVTARGYGYPVTAQLARSWFPTREYEDFALPAGNYTALRVVIGEGSGRNWWCVVFPPLCLSSATENVQQTAAAAGLTRDQVALITGEDGGYIVKFKAVELWEQLKAAVNGAG